MVTSGPHAGAPSSQQQQQVDNYAEVLDLGANQDAPPAYGDVFDQLQVSQPGFEAGAAVTDDGRVNININQKNSRLAALLAPTLQRQSQLPPDEQPPPPTLPPGPLPPAYIPPSLGGQPGQTPPPRLNVVIQIVGSRGDVQPFVALGKVLKETYGHRVRLATHATFQKFVEENGLEFFSIGGDPAELMAFMVKNPGLMPGFDALKSGEIKKRRQGIEEIVLGTWRSCIEAGNGLGPPPPRHRPEEPVDENYELPGNPTDRPFVADAIIANPPSFGHIHIAEKLGIPLHMMFTMPWSPTRAFPHPLANIESTNTDVVMTNYVSYALVGMMTWQGLGDVINRFRTRILDLDPLSLLWAPGLTNRLRIPHTYCWSPALIPKPADWAREISITGFYFLDLASSYTPDPDLAAFLAAGPPPVYIGFGSIVVDNPNALTRTIFDAVAATGVRALVSQGWGGLGADSVGIPDGVFMLGNCPHDWLFQHVSAVVHHGGAGTSAAGIKAGKPTVVVPFFGDQPFWGSMIARAGAGPAPIPFKKLTAENLAGAIREAIKPQTQARAQELGTKIREERGADEGGKSFHQFLNTPKMRCSLAPSRVAVWRVRRSQIRLSTLAAAVLAKERLIKYSDLKLYRPVEYNTEDRPWDPITAVTSALVGDIGNIAMAVADFPLEIFKGATSGKKGTAVSTSPSSEDVGKAESTPIPEIRSDAATETSSKAGELMGPISSRTSTAADPSSERNLSHQETQTTQPSSNDVSRATSRSRDRSPEPNPITIETAVSAGRGAGRIAGAAMTTPMNFCLGLARGFRNAPKLYGDDIREAEKVTDFMTGLKVAGKEFGFGMYDGISGLVTQPIKGAEKEGGRGLLKGLGKGLAGVALKPAAALWSLPAYTMQGVNAEVRNLFKRSTMNYIITSRVVQGKEDIGSSTSAEQRDILLRWQAKRGELKGYYLLKQREKKIAEQGETGAPHEVVELSDAPPKTGWLHTRNLTYEQRKKLHAQKDAWNRLTASRPSTATTMSTMDRVLEDEEFDRAILASVQQTSRGNPEEDEKIEQAIRDSVKEMRRIAEYSRDLKTPIPDPRDEGEAAQSGDVTSWEDLTNITDEEYQELIEQAVKQSLSQQAREYQYRNDAFQDSEEDEDLRRAIEASQTEQPAAGGDEEKLLQRVIEASRNEPPISTDNEEALLQRAMEASEREHQEQLQREKDEEEIVLEYVKKQSLAEEEYRQSRAAADKGKGKAVDREDDDVDDEDLRRALEESMRMHGEDDGAGPSFSAAGRS